MLVLTGEDAGGSRREHLMQAENAARAFLVNGRCDEALEQLGRLTYLQPPPARAGAIAAQCYARRQMWQKAIDELAATAERNPLQGTPWLGFMLGRAGRTEEARQLR